MIRTERTKARKQKKYDAIELRPYSDEEIEAIDAQYAAERRRGAESRSGRTSGSGTQVGPMVKGPLTVTDMVVLARRHGHGPLRRETSQARLQESDRIPRFFHRDELNVPT